MTITKDYTNWRFYRQLGEASDLMPIVSGDFNLQIWKEICNRNDRWTQNMRGNKLMELLCNYSTIMDIRVWSLIRKVLKYHE